MKKVGYVGVFFIVLIWSGINPHDYFTWFLEIIPALIGFVALAITKKSFPLTSLTYILILIHAVILMIGGHYTYAEVPLFEWIKELFHQSRNNYDKVGHFAQGFIPAMILREVLIRKGIVLQKNWRNFLIVATCLGFSAFYELIEWWVALFSGENADAFLGTQGYIWDTQSDMGLALLGAIAALLTLSKIHNKQLNKL